MARIRLLSPQYKTFSSVIGMTKFTNGLSDEDVAPLQITRIGALTRIEVIEEDGATRHAGPSQDIVDARHRAAEIKVARKPIREHVPPKEVPETLLFEPPKPKTDEMTDLASELAENVADIQAAAADVAGEEPVRTYTREELEAVADEDGITGLRKIGDTLDVKSNRIESLIDKVITAQAVRDAGE